MLRKILLLITLIFLFFWGYQVAKAKNFFPKTFFSSIEAIVPDKIRLPWNKEQEIKITEVKVEQKDLEKLGSDGLDQVRILAEKAKEAGSLAQDFVQDVVKVDENTDKNISEKAFEYGRYIYCQEVVKQYEASKAASF